MALSRTRIEAQGLTHHPHEVAAIDFILGALPDHDPYRVWALVDLIDLGGRRYEIDALILGYHALYLVEIKNWSGVVAGDAVDWRITHPDGKVSVRENPHRLTAHKARVLAGRLDRVIKGHGRPWVEPLIFMSEPSVRVELEGAARMGVVTRETFGRAITHASFPFASEGLQQHRVDKPCARETVRALGEIGIRPSAEVLRVGELVLGRLLEEGPGYQDRFAQHERMPEIRRRVRTYLVPQATTAERREQLRRAAEREARVLTLLGDHAGILSVTQYVAEGPTGGPCVVFEHIEDAVPLDAFLRSSPDLSLDDRMRLLELIGLALDYCHRKQYLHRGLYPGAVLVSRVPSPARFEVRLYNFQLAQEEDGSSGTVHLSALSSDRAVLYRAPEVIESPRSASPESDVFSLGAIAYHVLTGRSPGVDLAEREKLFAGGGYLSIAAARDDMAAAPSEDRKNLEDVVGLATCRSPMGRPESAIAWVNLLLETVTAPPPTAACVDPLEAKPGDKVAPEMVVDAVIGTGSTAKVLRVTRGSSELALKVPLSADLEERLRGEAAALEKVQSDPFVRLIDCPVLAGRFCLLLEYAGESLASLLARSGPVSLDYTHRWGHDLLGALRILEDRGVQHRDIKPANLGVPTSAMKTARHLRLFDFSLSSIDPRAVTAGTPAYRDPFLVSRGHWDAAADRYAAAVTLHEMLTCLRPRRRESEAGDEVIVEAERLDASLRDRLIAFFARSLARDAGARWRDAEEMSIEWSACFSKTIAASPAREAPAAGKLSPAEVAALSPDSVIAGLRLDARAKNALDRAGVITAGDLLALPQNQLSAMRGVGREVAGQILSLVDQIRQSAPALRGLPEQVPFCPELRAVDVAVDLVPGLSVAASSALVDAGLQTIAAVAAAPRARVERILAPHPGAPDVLRASLEDLSAGADRARAPRSVPDWIDTLVPPPRGRGETFLRHARLLLGVDTIGGERITDAGALARNLAITRQAVYASLARARERWLLHPAVPELRERVGAALSLLGGVAPLPAIAREVGRLLGHTASDPEVQSQAEALCRIAAETAQSTVLGRLGGATWLAGSRELLELAERLGATADRIAAREPLSSSEDVREVLAAAVHGTALEALSAERLVTLAAEASAAAAASARLELYPRGMPAARALALSAGALPPLALSPELVRRCVRARYPDAEPLPDRPGLDGLVAVLGLRWDEDQRRYVRPGVTSPQTSGTVVGPERRRTTHTSHRPPPTPESREAEEFWRRVRVAARPPGLHVVEVSAPFAEDAAGELARRLSTEAISIDRSLLSGAKELMSELEIDDSVVRDADRGGPMGDGWHHLRALMRRSAERLASRVSAASGAVILTHPGLLARYGLDDFLAAVASATDRDDGPAVLLVVPAQDDPGPASIDGLVPLSIPTTSPAQRLRVPVSWIANLDRGGSD